MGLEEVSRESLIMPVFEDSGHIGFGPANQGVDVRQQRACAVGDGIFHSWRHFGIDGARHHAVLLERAEGGGEHLLRDVGNLMAQSVVAHGLYRREGVKHKQCPLAAYACKGVAYRAVGKDLFVHNCLVFKLLYKGMENSYVLILTAVKIS